MRNISLKNGMARLSALLLAAAFLAASPEATAQEALCELDWNRDGVVNGDDFFKAHVDGTYSGFYVDVYRTVFIAQSLRVTRPNPHLDWNGDGVIGLEDAGSRNSHNLEDFYTQLYIFTNWYLRGYTQVYEQYYPYSDCNDPCKGIGDDDHDGICNHVDLDNGVGGYWNAYGVCEQMTCGGLSDDSFNHCMTACLEGMGYSTFFGKN